MARYLAYVLRTNSINLYNRDDYSKTVVVNLTPEKTLQLTTDYRSAFFYRIDTT